MTPGDVVIGAFPGVLGVKARPAVVLSDPAYQRSRPDVIVGLITTQQPRHSTATDCPIVDWSLAGLHAPSWFRLFVVTLPQTGLRVVGRLTQGDWAQVGECFRNGFGSASVQNRYTPLI